MHKPGGPWADNARRGRQEVIACREGEQDGLAAGQHLQSFHQFVVLSDHQRLGLAAVGQNPHDALTPGHEYNFVFASTHAERRKGQRANRHRRAAADRDSLDCLVRNRKKTSDKSVCSRLGELGMVALPVLRRMRALLQS